MILVTANYLISVMEILEKSFTGISVGRDRSLSRTTDELSGAFNGNKDDYI